MNQTQRRILSILAAAAMTCRALPQSAPLSLLKPAGVLVICAYPGHAEGDRERAALIDFLSALPPQQFNVLHQKFLNAGPGAPECFAVQKQRRELIV